MSLRLRLIIELLANGRLKTYDLARRQKKKPDLDGVDAQ